MRWNIATAKAELSRLVREARTEPQVIENRGRPVAVVVSADRYRDIAEGESATSRWRDLLALSAEIRAAGGASLRLPARQPRRSPLSRRSR